MTDEIKTEVIEEGADCKGWWNDDERYRRIKQQKKLTEYQLRLYKRALYVERKHLAKLEAGTQRRKENTNCMFTSRKELDAAYLVGAVTREEYRHQRSALWHTYSDRGHYDKIAWLEGCIEECENKLKMLDRVRRRLDYAFAAEKKRKAIKRRKINAAMRRYRKRLKEKKKAEEARLKAEEEGKEEEDE